MLVFLLKQRYFSMGYQMGVLLLLALVVLWLAL
jgi:hypothetical protein